MCPPKEIGKNSSLKDPVQEAFAILKNMQNKRADLTFQDYEISGAMLRLQLLRPGVKEGKLSQSFFTQASYLASFAHSSPFLHKLLLAPTESDLKNLKYLESYKTKSNQDTLSTVAKQTALSIPYYVAGGPLPTYAEYQGVLVAKSFRDSGVHLGDRGYLSYTAAAASSIQEQRLPIYVAGFYDPGILSVGNKCILVPHDTTQTINTLGNSSHGNLSEANGIQVWFKDLGAVEEVKKQLQEAFTKAGIAPYWKITTYKEYDFAKDLMQQFQSDKYLFTLVGIIILLVACCNIISLLVLLVNDKKQEIGILQAMGASSKSIATIFGICGMTMGIIGTLLGCLAALLTLHYIDKIVQLLSWIQGHDAFNALFYGSSLPSTLSSDALLFICITTPLLSLFAGLIPAIQACRVQPSQTLRS